MEYHRVLAGEERRIGRGILAIVLLVGGLLVFSALVVRGVASIDALLGHTTPPLGGTDYTPLHHAAGLGSVALLTPWSMLIQRWLYGVRPASLHSVVGQFRFALLGRTLVLVGPLWVVAVVVQNVLVGPQATVEWSFSAVIGILAVTFVLAPLQSAGEEYGVRGLVLRVAGSWARGPRAGLVVGIVASAVVFAGMHVAADPWLNAYYLTISLSLAIVTWRTGGVEAAAVIHAVNNTVSMAFAVAMHGDLGGGLSDRSAGVASAAIVGPLMAVFALVAVVVWWRTRRTGPARTPQRPPHSTHR